jgi:hypothetical protein
MTRTELPETIETPRLTLRGWQFDDVNAVHSYARDEEWAQYLRMLPLPYQRRDAVEFIARQTLLDRVRRPSWAIVLDGEVVGGINLRLGGAAGERSEEGTATDGVPAGVIDWEFVRCAGLDDRVLRSPGRSCVWRAAAGAPVRWNCCGPRWAITRS